MSVREKLVRNIALYSGLTFVICFGSMWLAVSSLQAAFLLGVIVTALATAGQIWLQDKRVKQELLKGLQEDISYREIEYGATLDDERIEWRSFDEGVAQLATRHFQLLGYFTVEPAKPRVTQAFALLLDPSTCTMAELMFYEAHGGSPEHDGVHYRFTSMVGGTIKLHTTNQMPDSHMHLLRSECEVCSCYPAMGLMELLDKHQRMLATVEKRSGWQASAGWNVERYVLQMREHQAELKRRLQKKGGFAMLREMERFDADPKFKWARSTEKLKKHGQRELTALDAARDDFSRQPLLALQHSEMRGSASFHNSAQLVMGNNAANHGGDNPYATSDSAFDAPELDDEAMERLQNLQVQVEQSANWCYWVAGLTLVNMVLSFSGMHWGFALGLSLPDLLSAFSTGQNDISFVLRIVLNLGGLLLVALFGVLGLQARKPSLMAFVAAIGVMTVDSLLQLLIYVKVDGSNPIGLLLHAYALYALVRGWLAGREMEKMMA
ncbi:hypothetical protein V8J88_08420 [Massilia sp. W12]|uniref:hypothetical protein n=1 Tax=Massilia sp. W12 TaxID=3126507 RepID=UPI0030CAAD43